MAEEETEPMLFIMIIDRGILKGSDISGRMKKMWNI